MGAGSSPSSLSPAPSLVLPKEIIVATPKPGTYTRDGVTRVASTPTEAVRLHVDGWVLDVPKDTPSETPKPKKPSTTEN